MMQKYGCLLVTLALAGVSACHGEETTFRGRNLVRTERGLWLEDHYIAIGSSRSVCDELPEKIMAWKRQHGSGALRTADDGSDDVFQTSSVHVQCFLPFIGNGELAKYVESLPGVLQVDQDLLVQATEDPASWGLNRIDQESLPLSQGVPFTTTHTGKGVNIYVVDTGINERHVEFALPGGESRAHLGADFVNEAQASDMNGHGTHCSGTAAGASYGIAREADIYGVKVLSGGGSGSTSGVIRGVEWAVQNQRQKFGNKAAVISMSLGGGKNTPMNQAVIDAAAAGHIVVVAAGNENQNSCNVSPASAGGNGGNPAIFGVVTVGATTPSDARASYSNFGDCVDIFAPGSGIKSSWIGSVTATNTISGTSMATPHVAGVAALLLEKHEGDKTAAQGELINLAVGGKVTDAKSLNNRLLQVPTYTGPPTPPTPQPTMPPTFVPPSLCVDDYTCAEEFAPSLFGPRVEEGEYVSAPLAKPKSKRDRMLCAPSTDDFTGKIVLIARGGCMFFDKVKNAEKQGAVGVIFYLTNKREVVFPPNYYDNDTTSVYSVMINLQDGNRFAKMIGRTVTFGSVERVDPECSAMSRRDCQKHPACTFGRAKGSRRKTCNNRWR